MEALRHVIMVSIVVLVLTAACGIDSPITPVDTVPPNPPVEIEATPDAGDMVRVSWRQNAEVDLSGYRLYRSSCEDGPFEPVTTRTLLCPWYTDRAAPVEVTYFRVTALDRSGNESAYSRTVGVYTNKRGHSNPTNPVGK
jgi:hypothetical protein